MCDEAGSQKATSSNDTTVLTRFTAERNIMAGEIFNQIHTLNIASVLLRMVPISVVVDGKEAVYLTAMLGCRTNWYD